MVALDAGAHGLEIIKRLLAEAQPHLRGRLALEIGYDQAGPLRTALEAHNYQDIRITTDYQGRNRFIFANYG
jgi:release factor glutamine methyltransferase